MGVKIEKPLWQALALGALAGFRSTSAPLVTSHILSRNPSKYLINSPLEFMQNPITANVTKVMAFGEIVGDKLPSAPNRTSAGGLIGRCLSGGVCGAAIYEANVKNRYVGAVIGGSAAIISTFGSFYLRMGAVKTTKINGPIIGALEDALTIGLGLAVIEYSE